MVEVANVVVIIDEIKDPLITTTSQTPIGEKIVAVHNFLMRVTIFTDAQPEDSMPIVPVSYLNTFS